LLLLNSLFLLLICWHNISNSVDRTFTEYVDASLLTFLIKSIILSVWLIFYSHFVYKNDVIIVQYFHNLLIRIIVISDMHYIDYIQQNIYNENQSTLNKLTINYTKKNFNFYIFILNKTCYFYTYNNEQEKKIHYN